MIKATKELFKSIINYLPGRVGKFRYTISIGVGISYISKYKE